jgi:DNA-binding MarR family transcriptional regulator
MIVVATKIAPTVPLSTPDLASDDLDETLVALLDAVLPRYQRVLRHALDRAEGEDRLTMPQLRCLQAMAEAPDLSLTTRLARQLRVTPPTMTRTIDGLVERGLVERRPDPTSRRQIALVLTASGRELLQRYQAIMDNRLRLLLTHLSPSQKARLRVAVMDIAAMLDADDRSASWDG